MPFSNYKSRLPQNLINGDYYIEDTSSNSPDYFDVKFFPDTVGGGKSVIKIKGNGAHLALNDNIKIEILDAAGNPMYYEVSSLIDRFNQYYISFDVYDNTAQGIGMVVLVGRATQDLQGQPVPIEWANIDNVIWTRQFRILPYERNNSELIFSKPPVLSVAQVLIPERIAAITASFLTSSLSSAFTITSTDFIGFDKTLTQDNGITDLDIKRSSINIDGYATTVNTVDTVTRTPITDGNGFLINKLNRYNTIIKSTTPFFNKNYVGAFFEITGSSTANYIISPTVYDGYQPAITASLSNRRGSIRYIGQYNPVAANSSGSLVTQLNNFSSVIVNVLDEKTAVLSNTPTLQGNTLTPTTITANQSIPLKKVSGSFTGIVNYAPSTSTYITSSNVSQSYIEFTFSDIRPIAGQVYKIRPFYKLTGRTGDYKLLTDQIIRPVEYLTDARYPNQTSYGKHISDYYLVGHFVETASYTRYWTSYIEDPQGFGSYTPLINSSSAMSSVQLYATSSTTTLLTTNFYQNYVENQSYTLTNQLTLDGYSELEVYMNSQTLNTNLTSITSTYPIGFYKTNNLERDRYPDTTNRFGKLIGKVTNNSPLRKNYGLVGFDFTSDDNGLGKPLFRLRRLQNSTADTVYGFVSEVSITPTALNGFTPNIIQFAVPVSSEITTALSQSIDFKLEYFDYTGKQSEYVTFLDDIKLNLRGEISTNSCQAEQLSWNFNPHSWHKTPTASVSFLDWYHDTLTPITTSFNSAFFSASGQYYWPAIEYLQGGFSIGGNTYNTPLPFWALTWGSYVSTADTPLWNVQHVSMLDNGNLNNTHTNATLSFTNNYPATTLVGGTTYSNVQGKITSSWQYVTKFTEQFGSYSGNGVTDLTTHIISSGLYYENINNQTFVTKSIIDNQAFNEEGCLGITRTKVSHSYANFIASSSTADKTWALKSRRLMYPMNGSHTASYFTTNGGIYNVKFKLKRSGSYSPDTGSYLDIYIFNNNATYQSSTAPGTVGWKPPSANIVTIGHAYNYTGSFVTPLVSNYDPFTGAYYDEYDITLIQYGIPGQLVFDPGGLTASNAYFGTLIDDISFCKIGVTTDPRYIKPYSRWNRYNNTFADLATFAEVFVEAPVYG